MIDMAQQARSQKKYQTKSWPIANEAQVSIDSTFATLNTSQQGLTSQQAEVRLEQFGLNQVAQEKAPHALIQLLMAFKNPFIFVLMGLASISFFTDYWLPAQQGEETDLTGVIIMSVMIGLSGLLRFWQEFRTNKAADALKSLVRTQVTTRRRHADNSTPQWMYVNQQQLVPGDIISISAGDIIPADIKLIESQDLLVSQAALTGEALPVEKFCLNDQPQTAHEIGEGALPGLPNVCLMGTNVVSGHATAVVVATGNQSWFGSLAKNIVGKRAPTSFDRGVNSVSWLLIRFMFIMVPIVFVINGMTKGDWLDAALFAVAVAVGLTPEMLPMIVSTNLAKGAMAMARRKVVVKRLNAIQNFGAMDVLCTDKTGTLTQDHIALEQHLDVQGRPSRQVLDLAWLNSYHQSGLKNLMDRAVLEFARNRQDLPRNYRKVDELPFDFTRRRLSVTVSNEQGQHQLICKGALEEMLAITTHLSLNGKVEEMTPAWREEITQRAAELNQQGYRVLLVATRTMEHNNWYQRLKIDDERDLTLCGMLTFLDPAKESAAAAIQALQHNGVQVKILTGDNPLITAKICRDLGVDAGVPMLGDEIEQLDDEQLKPRIELHTIFAKLTPSQKERVVTLLQKNGHTVGFLGDGINDAAALRAADVGISVDSATDIAKESADIILLEKSLMVLEQGVLVGRQTFGNIIKYLNITASSNFGNVFSILVASAFIPFLPMLAIQLLLQNLIYDISQLALPWDKMDKEFVRKPRKWDAKNIGRFMLWMGPTSSVFDISTFALMWYIFGANNVDHQALFQSGWFIEGLLSQTLVVHMLRTQKIPFIQTRATWPIMLTTLLVVIIGIGLPFSPINSWFGLQALPLSYFPWLLATLLGYCLLSQGMKQLYMRKFGQWF
ncbi:magnesium-translocating P-type ATPase [Winslowiella toletana]|uniref:magnesium-translocating P-type ATPase n=1 Tax=Winslowiella toletana TaxID=92490 RepID=UPI0028BF265B|nr:magnesium-translocating P-type ATPase [Winslowiella toletana]WNN46466.1 magnesium-translocating P-type ATPase [Winslowiella toletana]